MTLARKKQPVKKSKPVLKKKSPEDRAFKTLCKCLGKKKSKKVSRTVKQEVAPSEPVNILEVEVNYVKKITTKWPATLQLIVSGAIRYMGRHKTILEEQPDNIILNEIKRLTDTEWERAEHFVKHTTSRST